MPIGVPIDVAIPTMINDPTMALARPPPSVFGDGVISVKVCADRPPMPSEKVVMRIQISQKRPNAIAASDSVSATLLTIFRWAKTAFRGVLAIAVLMPSILRKPAA